MDTTMKRILCGINLNDPVTPAIAFAHRLAAATGAQLDLLGRLEPNTIERPPEYLAEVHATAAADLDALDGGPGEVSVTHETITTDLVGAVVERAERDKSDLVVVGAHPVAGATSMALGSLGHELAHRLDCPVAEVCERGGLVRGGTYVVGIDGSDASRAALDWTRALAAATSSACVAVVAIDPIYGTFQSHGWYGKEERAAARTADSDDDVELVERRGDPAETLRSVATERDAAAIVVAARDRHGLDGWFLGKVPDHLLHNPQLPTIVLPHRFTKHRG